MLFKSPTLPTCLPHQLLRDKAVPSGKFSPLPVVTNTIVVLPFLMTGSLLLEKIFQIPGFGGLLVDAIFAQDSPVIMAQVYLTAAVYALMLFLTDICYTIVDPRITLK